jgi:hypothetical protein
MNYAATLMNCILIGSVNQNQLINLIGKINFIVIFIGNLTFLEIIVLLVIVEHVILFLKYLIALIIDDVPQWISKEKDRREFMQN